MRNRFHTFSVVYFSLALASISASAADPVLVKIPCGSVPWLSCADLKTKLMDGVAGGDFPGGMKAAIREMLDDVYLMKVRLAPNLVAQPECTTFDRLNKPPICSPLRIPENGCADESTRSYKVPEGVNANCPGMSMVGAASMDHPLFSLGYNDMGSRESSNVAAGLLMAVSNQGYEISAEVSQNALKILPSSSCYQRAVSLNDLIAAQSDVRLIEQINACDPNNQTEACSAKEYFKASHATILSAYLQLARCRLIDEASKKFVAFTKDGSKPYTQVLKDLYVQQCFYPYRGNPSAMRSCYAAKYSAWIRARARAAFPHVASGCP